MIAFVAAFILAAHVAGGTVAIGAGFTALFARKGGSLHRLAGNLFFVAMLVNGVTASVLGYIDSNIGDFSGGVMSVYFIATAWVAARRADLVIGAWERWLIVIPIAMLAANIHFARLAAGSADGTYIGFPAVQYYVVAGIMGLAAGLDLNLILRRGLAGSARIARHLWRMCMGMFVATGSLFLGQMQVFPEAIRRIEILAAPVVLVVGSMYFWLGRVLLTNWRRN